MHRNILLTLCFIFAIALGIAPAPRAEGAPADDGSQDMFIGQEDAPITMIAYESLVCPHCAAFHANSLPKLKEEYVEKGLLKIVFRELPGSRDNPWPAIPAMMARCLGKDRYFQVVDLLFRDQEKWLQAKMTGQQFMDNVLAYGRLAGMTKEQFDACLKNEKILNAMQTRWQEAVQKYGSGGALGTPFFVIGDKTIAGNRPLAEFEAVLKPLVEKAPKGN